MGLETTSSLRLLAGVPAKRYDRLIVRYPYQSDRDYAHAYHAAAQRLASTYTGEPEDDAILIPYLLLYRHAFELQMKDMIRQLVAWRRDYGYGASEALRPAELEEHLKNRLGHRLGAILRYVTLQYDAVEPSEPFPDSVTQVVTMLHEADKAGMAFRYSGLLPETQDNADFFDLQTALDEQFDLLSVTLDPISAGIDAMPDPNEFL